jgi:hypothetical protein
MIFGDYPCCGGFLSIQVPEKTPVFQREECPHCGKVVWHRLSRIDPESWTEKDFLKEYAVDEVTKVVTLRNPPPEQTELERELSRRIAKKINQDLENLLLYGDGNSDARRL